MATIPRQEVLAHAALLQHVQREAGAKAKAAIRAWLAEHPTWEAADLRNFAIAMMQAIVDDYGAAASSLACDLYDGTMGGEYPPAVPWDGGFARELERTVRYQLQKALDGDLDGFADAMDAAAQYYVRQYANETTMANCERDSRAYAPGGLDDDEASHGPLHQPMPMDRPLHGKGNALATPRRRRRSDGKPIELGEPAFARVPTGAETCTYCLMLASRGFAYHSAKSAGHADHRGCNCAIVPGHKGDAVEGVDEGALYDCWRELEALEAWQAGHPDEMDAAELERRKKAIVEGYGDKVMVDSSPGAVRKLAKSNPALSWYEPRARMAANYEGGR